MRCPPTRGVRARVSSAASHGRPYEAVEVAQRRAWALGGAAVARAHTARVPSTAAHCSKADRTPSHAMPRAHLAGRPRDQGKPAPNALRRLRARWSRARGIGPGGARRRAAVLDTAPNRRPPRRGVCGEAAGRAAWARGPAPRGMTDPWYGVEAIAACSHASEAWGLPPHSHQAHAALPRPCIRRQVHPTPQPRPATLAQRRRLCAGSTPGPTGPGTRATPLPEMAVELHVAHSRRPHAGARKCVRHRTRTCGGSQAGVCGRWTPGTRAHIDEDVERLSARAPVGTHGAKGTWRSPPVPRRHQRLPPAIERLTPWCAPPTGGAGRITDATEHRHANARVWRACRASRAGREWRCASFAPSTKANQVFAQRALVDGRLLRTPSTHHERQEGISALPTTEARPILCDACSPAHS